MDREICRRKLKDYLGANAPTNANAGLLMRRGMTHYQTGSSSSDAGKGRTEKQELIKRITTLNASDLYRAAFRRWKAATANGMRFTCFEAGLIGRLYIGVTRESALETSLTVHHAYGMPLIPGSALKGLARSIARERLTDHPDALTWLFGADTKADATEMAEAGSIIFHDAWWVPNGKPFVEEVVTPHHRDYYNLGSAAATDFDSPVPAPQIAAQGSFLFVLEGEPAWCEIARALLQSGLESSGIGGKRSSGYGYFDIS